MYQVLFRLVVFGTLLFSDVMGHGRMIEPPSRASMFRFGFDAPQNWEDNEMWCGGLTALKRNKGKCGVCGDPWNVTPPRRYETGGAGATGIIVRKYRTGDVIPVTIDLSVYHRGYFEFRICPMTRPDLEVTEECLDEHILVGEDGTTRYYPTGKQIVELSYKLPDDMTCAQCVLQWRYVAGNNWEPCGNGTEAIGCGIQEQFRACADVSIGDSYEPSQPPHRPVTSKMSSTQSGTSTTMYTNPSPTEPSVVSDRTGSYWLFSLFIVVTTLLVVLAALALLYTYYYHAGRAKKWLMAGKLLPRDSTPVAPPRQKKHQSSQSVLHLPLEV